MKKILSQFKDLFRCRRGNALVEFALTFPTLVVVTLMIFDLGRALFVYTTVNNVAAEGARYAAVHGSTSPFSKSSAEIQTFIVNQAAGLEPANITVTLTYTPNNSFPGSEVEVQVDYELGFFISGIIDMIADSVDATLTLTGKSTMSVL